MHDTGAPKDNPMNDPAVVEAIKNSTPLPTGGVVNWVKKTPVKYPAWSQATSLSCVSFDLARQLSVRIFVLTGVWLDFSPSSIYQLRENQSTGGMNILDSHKLMETRGVTLEALMKSQGLSEAQINAVKRTDVANEVALAFSKVKMSFVPVNIEGIARVLQTGKAVGLLIFASEAEFARRVPVAMGLSSYENAEIRHKITAVDHFLDSAGVEKILINDSAHFGGYSERELTADFISKRVLLADYISEFTLDPSVISPYYFEVNMKLGETSIEVAKLQQFLKNEGYFPAPQEVTSFYGPITAKALLAWQLENVKTVGKAELVRLKGENFGPASRAAANAKTGILLPNTGTFPDHGTNIPSVPYSGISP